jgi:AcrR family transcriptional regulator
MAAKAKGSRSAYRSPLRARHAEQTRLAVLEGAARLFTERGWAGTTLAAVAAEAGTAVETVYAGFGSKSGLLTAAIDAAIVGDVEPVPLAHRPQYGQVGVGTREQRMRAAAHIIALAHDRSVPLLRALQEAAASDAAALERWEKYEADRRTEIVTGLGLVLGRRPPDRLADAVWAIACPEVYAKLVLHRRWSIARYERWLVDVADALIGDTKP